MAYLWHDAFWLKNRSNIMRYECAKGQPINIYGICPFSWKKRGDSSCFTLAELSRELVPYVKQMGYTHVNLDRSFLLGDDGYTFIDGLHSAGVGVTVTCSSDEDHVKFLNWLQEYHVDGIICQGEIKELLPLIKNEFPDVLFFENGISGRAWTDVALSYMQKDPIYRKYHHDELISATEQLLCGSALLSVTGADVVNGKRSLLDKMYGEYNEKFAGLRVFLSHMMTVPSKKLLFMGSEIGQFSEWDSFGQLDWFLLGFEKHAQMQKYVSDLNMLYLEESALWEGSFEWLDSSADMSIISYKRTDKDGNELFVILNFTPVFRDSYIISTADDRACVEVFSSDDAQYGGSGYRNHGELMPRDYGEKHGVSVNIPPLTAIILKKIKR